jgi:hypothetical protein
MSAIVKYTDESQLVPGAKVHLDTQAIYLLTDGPLREGDDAIVIDRPGASPTLASIHNPELYGTRYFIRRAKKISGPAYDLDPFQKGIVEFVEVGE